MQVFLGLIVLAILIFILSSISEWVQRRKIDHEKDENRARHQEYSERYPYAQKRNQFSLPTHVYAITNQLGAYKRQQERSERRRTTREKLTIGGIFITAAFALGQGLIFYNQLNEMHVVHGSGHSLPGSPMEFLKSANRQPFSYNMATLDVNQPLILSMISDRIF